MRFYEIKLVPDCVCKDALGYVEVALALETLAYHNRNYLSAPYSKNEAEVSKEIQALLKEAIYVLKKIIRTTKHEERRINGQAERKQEQA